MLAFFALPFSTCTVVNLLLSQVQTVAANTGLDRTEVLAWVAAFRAKPKAEQAKLLAPLQQQIQQLKAQQQAQSNAAQAAEAARRGRSLEQQQQQQPAWQEQEQEQEQELQPRGSPAARQPQGLPFSGKNPDTGFVPYTERRSQAGGKKRLPGEVLRTLEGVYARSPWPNKEVVAGLYDLHRLPRCVLGCIVGALVQTCLALCHKRWQRSNCVECHMGCECAEGVQLASPAQPRCAYQRAYICQLYTARADSAFKPARPATRLSRIAEFKPNANFYASASAASTPYTCPVCYACRVLTGVQGHSDGLVHSPSGDGRPARQPPSSKAAGRHSQESFGCTTAPAAL